MTKRRRSRRIQETSGRGWLLLVLVALSVMLYQDGTDLAAGLLRASQAFAPFRLSQTRLIRLPAFSAWSISLPGETRVIAEEQAARAYAEDHGGETPRLISGGNVTLKVTGTRLQLDVLEEAASSFSQTLALLSELSFLPDNEASSRAAAALPGAASLCARLQELFSSETEPTVGGLCGLLNACQEALSAVSRDGAEAAAEKFSSLALQFCAYSAYLLR